MRSADRATARGGRPGGRGLPGTRPASVLVVAVVAALVTACAPGATAPRTSAPTPSPEAASPKTASPEAAARGAAARESASEEAASPEAAPGRVRIPAIGVDSPLLGLGVAADGSAEVPQDYRLAGWFGGAGRPGGPGPTVLLGHVDSRTGPAVFYRLRELGPGAVVEVLGDDGSLARYAVERTEQVPKGRFPTFAVFGAVPDDVLRLVTCAGEFDRGARSYSDNLVVHARRV